MAHREHRGRLLHLLALVALIFPMLAALLPPRLARADHQLPTPSSVTIAGSLQDELGCGGDWQPECTATGLTLDATDGIWQRAFAVPAGSYEYKAALNGTWDENYGANATANGANIPLTLTDPVTVTFYYDHKTHWITDNQSSVIATVAGDFQSELGCPGDWQPECLRSWLQDANGDGTYTFETTALPAGSYSAKVAINEGWDENYGVGGAPGGDNIAFAVPADGAPMTFSYDATSHILTISSGSGAGHDNNIFWNDLGHDSRDALYRAPGGAVPTNTPVQLRLRAASGDLTAARLRLWNDLTDTQLLLNMARVADDGRYEWWEATVPASAEPTIYWYRFIAMDGTATAYYEDDEARTGGWGQPVAESPDRSWQLTVYDPTFRTPSWVQNGIMYQIFIDRFRDAVPTNNTPAGSFFYDTPQGTILRSNQANWNQPVCDPRDEDSVCPGKYSENFYGGDLQGIVQKLDYLQSLGVTVLYLNPIFESPSNHKYDTTDYRKVDDNFGGNDAFQALVTAAQARGMKIVLDGVFNHTSSDSIYFDRYQRYPDSLGACESLESPHRDWYYFKSPNTAGTGECAGDSTYESWFGYDSLPKLRANEQAVRDLIWSGGPNAIARYWMQWADGWRLDVGGDVDPGRTNAPSNDYWEGFRDAVHATKPNAYIVGEEWGFATPWTLGQEWDATMNYQTSSAIMSFWRDAPFTDNDHNSGSSAGVLAPLTPRELDERLHNIAERYPPEALHAMMNLLGSHDTNRPLFMLDHNTGQNDPSLYENPSYDWSDAMTRMRGVVLFQMTLPGAPTIYYGDEIGLVGPVAWDGSQWQDDPYNRQPYPWLDASGTPFYTHLRTQAGQNALLDYYKLLTSTRHAHPALRTGSFDTLLAEGNNVYAYGRKLADNSDAAIVIANRVSSEQSVTLNLSGYLPIGATLQNVLAGNTSYTIPASGEIALTIPARGGALLVLTGGGLAAPAAVTTLALTGERSHEVSLAWSAASDATSYDVYRSLVSGGGYTYIANTTSTVYTDTGLMNAQRYYYVVVSRDDNTGLSSGYSNEVAATPHHDLGSAWYNLQWPPEITHTISALTPTTTIYGQLYIAGATEGAAVADGIIAQVGYGPVGSAPTGEEWMWEDMTFNSNAGNNDEYRGTLLPDMVGEYLYTTRYSSDGGASWRYTDLDGPEYSEAQAGRLHVVPSSDTTAPDRPPSVQLDGTTASSISFSWQPSSAPDVVYYEIYRKLASASNYERLARVESSVTSYTDMSVMTGATYDYYVVAVDSSFNRSVASDVIQARAEPRMVQLTVNVTVPAFTTGTVYIVGNNPAIGNWDPAAIPMTPVAGTTTQWTISLSVLDGTALQYKFTRGNWETVEKEADGNTEIDNRQLTADFGASGVQTLNLTVANWRDPIVVSHAPAKDATNVPLNSPISVTWSQPMRPESDFTVNGPEGPISGTFAFNGNMLTFTPAGGLRYGTTYAVVVADEVDAGGDVQQSPEMWTFRTAGSTLFLPVMAHRPSNALAQQGSKSARLLQR